MDKKILIEAGRRRTRLALLEDGDLCEYYEEREGSEKLSGNIYAGRVENVLPGMQAAFVDIGLGKNAFLHLGDIQAALSDLDGGLKAQMEKNGTMRLRPGQELLVQVVKEPGGSKGPRISSHITLPGRYCVLMPGVSYVGVSRKIEDEETRQSLRTLAQCLCSEDAGLIMRTAAAQASEETVGREVAYLSRLWKAIELRARHSTVPALLHRDDSLTQRAVRDMLTPEVSQLTVDDPQVFREVQEAAQALVPELCDRIHLAEGETPLFSVFRVDAALENAYERRVWLKSGGYLVIDHTEALTVIDVNTGKFVGSHSLEETVLKTNCEAAKEIARQLRLRDVGGIVVIDFIDMSREADRNTLLEVLAQELRRDRNKPKLVDITPLGLVELTRKKTRQSLHSLTRKQCPRCKGIGTVLTEQTLAQRALYELRVRAAHAQSSCWLITASNAVFGALLQLDVPDGLTVYAASESGRLNEDIQIEATSLADLPAKARRMTNEQGTGGA